MEWSHCLALVATGGQKTTMVLTTHQVLAAVRCPLASWGSYERVFIVAPDKLALTCDIEYDFMFY